jgi:hypothetical protein
MEHPEEHKLELYVLGSQKVALERKQMEEHLTECAGCASIVADLTAFYAAADADFDRLRTDAVPERRTLAKTQAEVKPFDDRFGAPLPYVDRVPMSRVRYFVYKHPFVAGGGTFALGVAAVLALSLLRSAGPVPIRDTNPSYKIYNEAENRIDIYNKYDQKLWDLPTPEAKDAAALEREFGAARTVVADLDSDGLNEVLTTRRIGDEPPYPLCLKIFDSTKEIRKRICFDRRVDYLARQNYSPLFNASSVLVNDRESGKKEILVTLTNSGRSPCFIARLDAQGNEIGTYWHFGNVDGLFPIECNGTKGIILVGINDTPDTVRGEFPVVIVLDPTKIRANRKSSASPGFGLPFSDAELYYVRIPLTDMHIALNQHAVVRSLDVHRNDVLDFNVAFPSVVGGYEGEENPAFDYIFSKDMSVLQVKSTTSAERFHAIMARQGKVRGRIDEEYLENLKNGVRYWDGKEWRKEKVMVHSEQRTAGVAGR